MPAPRLAGLNRRAMLNLLGSGVGLGLVSRWRGAAAVSPAFQARGGRGAATSALPRGAIIRTVLKDLAPADLGSGALLFHEHVGANTSDPLLIEEIDAAKKAGVSCLVSARAGGRQNVANLRAVSTETGMPIVACTGYYMQSAYPKEILAQTEDQIAEDLVEEARRDGLGAFGEIGQTANSASLTPDELKVFRAVGKAHVRTNLPVFTHNPYGTGPNVARESGLRQLDALEAVGVRPERVAIGHVCCLEDPKADVMKQIAKRGAYVGFDRMADHHPPDPKGPVPGAVKDTSDDLRVRMILEFLDAGYANRLLLADDATTQARAVTGQVNQMVKDQWLTAAEGASIKATLNKAIAFGRTLTVFVPKLRAAGVKEETLRTIVHDNPLRFMAFEPKMG
jgi:phosphotriesterase-related protein